MKLQPSLLRSWFETIGTSAGIVVLGLLTGVLAARLLGPDDRGLLAIALFWPSLIASFTFLSVGDAVVYRRNYTQLRRERFLATVVLTSLLLALLGVLSALLLVPWLLGSERADQVPLMAAYAAVFMPCYFVAMGLLSVEKSEQNFRRYNVMRFSNPLVYLLGIVVLWLSGNTNAENFIWAAFLGTAFNVGLCIWLVRQEIVAWPSTEEASALLRRGVTFHGATIVTAVSSQADKVVVMSSFQNSDIGKYVVALTLASATTALVTRSFNTILFPSIAATVERSAKIQQLQDGMRRTVFVVVGISSFAAIFLPPLLPLVFGNEFGDARSLVAILAIAIAPMTIRQVVMSCVRAFGDGRTGVVVESTALLLFAIFVFPALIIDELWAVAAAFGLANTGSLLFAARLLQRHYGIAAASWLLPNGRMIDDIRMIGARLFQPRIV